MTTELQTIYAVVEREAKAGDLAIAIFRDLTVAQRFVGDDESLDIELWDVSNRDFMTLY